MSEQDLEAYRSAHKMSYATLAKHIGVSQARTAYSYALGMQWPSSERLQRILDVTGGEVTVDAMHKRRLQWVTSQKVAS